MVHSKLKLLINLARIDREVGEKEAAYIINIAVANGVPESDARGMFKQDHELIVPRDLSDEQRFEYIFELVQLMKIDERLYKDEIRYCSQVASRLGYSQDVIFDLMLHVREVMETNKLESLKKMTIRSLRGGSTGNEL